MFRSIRLNKRHLRKNPSRLKKDRATSRTYYADSIDLSDISRKVDAKIVSNKNQVELQTKESHDLHKLCRSEDFRESIFDVQRESQEFNLKKKYYDVKLSIDADKRKITENPYTFNSSALLDLYQTNYRVNSDGHVTQLSLGIPFEGLFLTDLPFMPPDILYSIDKSLWDSFIDELDNQEIVSIFNLSKNRHLWPAYNYAVSHDNPSVAKMRAQAFSQNHFLLSFINKNQDMNMGKSHQDLFSQSIREFLTRNDKSNDSHEQLRILEAIDHHESPVHLLKQYSQAYTPTLLNKFAACPSWMLMQYVVKMLIVPKVTSWENDIVLKSMHGYIADLPSSLSNPKLFSNMIDSAYQQFSYTFNPREYEKYSQDEFKKMRKRIEPNEIPALYGDIKLCSNLFYHRRREYKTDHNVAYNYHNIIHYARTLYYELILPEIMRTLLASGSIKEMMQFNQINTYLAVEHFIAYLTERYTMEQMNDLIARRDHNKEVIESKKPEPIFHDGNKWHHLFEPLVIDGMTFSCLGSRKELLKEGSKMNHCVGGYSQKCLNGSTHIIHVGDANTGGSTLELRVHDGGQCVILQHTALGNASPTQAERDAAKKLLHMLNAKEIKMNLSKGSMNNSDEELLIISDIERQLYLSCKRLYKCYPYPVMDLSLQEQVYSALKETKCLPPCLVAKDYQSALAKGKIADFIQYVLSRVIENPAPNQMARPNGSQ